MKLGERVMTLILEEKNHENYLNVIVFYVIVQIQGDIILFIL